MVRPVALALICFYWTLAARAQASEDNNVRATDTLVQSALSAFERQDYPVALSLFERASVSAPSLTVRLYLARSRVALGQLVAGAADYRSVVTGAEGAPASPSDQRALIEARDELSQLRPRIPSIEITVDEAEQRSRKLRLAMDGRSIMSGVVILVDPGRHEVMANAADGEQSRFEFEIGEGEAKMLGTTWSPVSERADKKADHLVGSASGRRAWGVVALSVGATGLGIGTVTGIAAMTRYSAAEAHCPANRCTQGPPYPEDGSAFRTLRTISAAGYVLGGAGIGTWLGLLLTTPKATTEHPKVSRWTPVVGMGSAGARYIF